MIYIDKSVTLLQKYSILYNICLQKLKIFVDSIPLTRVRLNKYSSFLITLPPKPTAVPSGGGESSKNGKCRIQPHVFT